MQNVYNHYEETKQTIIREMGSNDRDWLAKRISTPQKLYSDNLNMAKQQTEAANRIELNNNRSDTAPEAKPSIRRS